MKATAREAGRTERPEAVFMVGGTGAGKSYVRRQTYPNHVVVDCDQFKKSHPNFDPDNPQALHEWSRQECVKLFHRTLGADASFVYDGTGSNEERHVHWMRLASDAGFRVVLHFVRCPLAVALMRNSRRTRTVPESIVRQKHAVVEESFEACRFYADRVAVTENWTEAEMKAAQES